MDRYVRWKGLREPDLHTPLGLVKNIALNARLGRLSWRYPRERLYPWLPRLLGLAGPAPRDWPAESARFLCVWRRFN